MTSDSNQWSVELSCSPPTNLSIRSWIQGMDHKVICVLLYLSLSSQSGGGQMREGRGYTGCIIFIMMWPPDYRCHTYDQLNVQIIKVFKKCAILAAVWLAGSQVIMNQRPHCCPKKVIILTFSDLFSLVYTWFKSRINQPEVLEVKTIAQNLQRNKT